MQKKTLCPFSLGINSTVKHSYLDLLSLNEIGFGAFLFSFVCLIWFVGVFVSLGFFLKNNYFLLHKITATLMLFRLILDPYFWSSRASMIIVLILSELS